MNRRELRRLETMTRLGQVFTQHSSVEIPRPRFPTFISPSPRPSPHGRGRIVRQLLDEQKHSVGPSAGSSVSLSFGERAGVRILRNDSRLEPLNRSGRHPACSRAGASSPAEMASRQSTRRNGWQHVRAAGCPPSTAGRMPSATWRLMRRRNTARPDQQSSHAAGTFEPCRCFPRASDFSH